MKAINITPIDEINIAIVFSIVYESNFSSLA
jgi:hypothetical protein